MIGSVLVAFVENDIVATDAGKLPPGKEESKLPQINWMILSVNGSLSKLFVSAMALVVEIEAGSKPVMPLLEPEVVRIEEL